MDSETNPGVFSLLLTLFLEALKALSKLLLRMKGFLNTNKKKLKGILGDYYHSIDEDDPLGENIENGFKILDLKYEEIKNKETYLDSVYKGIEEIESRDFFNQSLWDISSRSDRQKLYAIDSYFQSTKLPNALNLIIAILNKYDRIKADIESRKEKLQKFKNRIEIKKKKGTKTFLFFRVIILIFIQGVFVLLLFLLKIGC